jgi:spermidine/putrescine transport system substrate-binding protein
MDNLAVAKGAPNLDNAKAFINFAMAPENTAMITTYARYSNGIKGSEAFIEPALAAAPEVTPPADAPASEFVPTCSPEAAALTDRVWAKLMNLKDTPWQS